ncbi:MAG: hypothetical protein ACLTKA_05525 [Acutalibacteraceae bacterium]|nr:hypothetical protein [Clostridiales bacterium]
MQSRAIDNERAFDWGRTSADYARCRNIYPPEFFRLLLDAGLCAEGRRASRHRHGHRRFAFRSGDR